MCEDGAKGDGPKGRPDKEECDAGCRMKSFPSPPKNRKEIRVFGLSTRKKIACGALPAASRGWRPGPPPYVAPPSPRDPQSRPRGA